MDLLLHRYGVAILGTDIDTGFELIQEVYKKQLDEKLWQRWLVDYARMDKDSFISFDDYKKDILKTPTKFKRKSKEEIFKQADNIIMAWKKHK